MAEDLDELDAQLEAALQDASQAKVALDKAEGTLGSVFDRMAAQIGRTGAMARMAEIIRRRAKDSLITDTSADSDYAEMLLQLEKRLEKR